MPVSTYGASKLAGEALIASYAHMFDLHGPRVPLRQRGRPAARPTASASTSSAGCSPTRPGSRSSATARRASPTSTSTTSRRRAARRRRRPTTPFAAFNVATGDYITVTEIAELADRGARPRPGVGRARATPAATAAGRATSRSSGSPPTRSARSAGATSARVARGAARLDAVDARRRPRRAARGEHRPRAGRLPRPRRRAQRAPSSATARPYPPGRPEEVVLLPGVGEACRRLADAGLAPRRRHQPARHRPRHAAPRAEVDAMQRGRARGPADRRGRGLPARRRRRLRVPQAAARACSLDAARALRLDLGRSVIVGDRWRDIEAGTARRACGRSSSTTATTRRDRRRPITSSRSWPRPPTSLDCGRPAGVDDWDAHWGDTRMPRATTPRRRTDAS